MTKEDFQEMFTCVGILVHFNLNLSLWQIMIDNHVIYLTKNQVEEMNRNDVQKLVASNIANLVTSGEVFKGVWVN